MGASGFHGVLAGEARRVKANCAAEKSRQAVSSALLKWGVGGGKTLR